MLSPSSVKTFHDDKKPKKKYQKFKNCHVQDNFATAGKFESDNSRTVWKSEMNVKESFNRSINPKDFPELRKFRKQTNLPSNNNNKNNNNNNKSYESSSNETLAADVIGNQKKSMETFPTLLVTANHKTDEVNVIKNEGKSDETVAEERTSALSRTHHKVKFEKPVNANININREVKVSSSKKCSLRPQVNFNKKKRADPILINFQDILKLNIIRGKRKQCNTLKTKVQRFRHKEFLSGNLLDSSNPKRNRGKHREVKNKKLSTFKMTIIKERILKQKIKEIAIDANVENVCFNLINKIDFKSEMKTYLNKLNEKKIKNTESIKNKVKENSLVKNINEEKQENLETKLVEKKENSGNASDNKEEEKLPKVLSHEEIKFSSKFREYCDNIITPDLNTAVSELIKELIKLQDKLFSRDPVKAKIKKRHVSGIREVRKYLTLKKVKMIIIAPNLEKLQMEGSIYDSINELKSMANAQNVTYGFALDRYKLGRCTKKNVPVSAFAVLNYEGVEDLYRNVVHKLQEAKKKFFELIESEKAVENVEKKEDVNAQIISSLISAFREDLRVSKKDESQAHLRKVMFFN